MRHYVWIVLSGFMLNFTACSVVFAYGIFQAEYEKMADQEGTPFTGASSAEITLIGSLSSAMMKLGAPFVVPSTNELRSLLQSNSFSPPAYSKNEPLYEINGLALRKPSGDKSSIPRNSD